MWTKGETAGEVRLVGGRRARFMGVYVIQIPVLFTSHLAEKMVFVNLTLLLLTSAG